ncbi:tripartite tricarboxylate transporter TctB family protein [Arsenicitalea aurantiaca]|uniref:Tripartite tricarboxylate transporter TctB family protein n=1 Tax=Arsenicitalea aurantiaca TaxID=1783274 RepID=A0A433XL52_9HYPH|nr:tripartite tricarboxylate transporter TctB family protein [Arsenicitalea aurantiaca]RUT34805.1 tripartite tricarboxylate transporter TctB family protein [Arsenicitalea aurantiaca]
MTDPDTEHEPDDAGLWPQPTSMRRVHQIAALLLVLFGAFIVWQALGLRFYTSLGPGPGFFSFWLGASLIVLALIMFVGARWGRAELPPPGFFADRQGYLGMAGIVGGLLAASLLLRPLGFPLTLMAIMFVMLKLVGRTGWTTAVLGALIGGPGVYLLFVHWLRVPLPAGITSFLG